MVSVKVTPRLRTNSGDTCRVAALRGQGIVLQPSFLVGPDLRAGTLLNFVGCVERAADEESWTTRRPWQELNDDYAGWHPMVRAVIDAVDRELLALLNRRAGLALAVEAYRNGAANALRALQEGAETAVDDVRIQPIYGVLS